MYFKGVLVIFSGPARARTHAPDRGGLDPVRLGVEVVGAGGDALVDLPRGAEEGLLHVRGRLRRPRRVFIFVFLVYFSVFL